ncbi:hypothetical protein TWF225_009247 [Orbilia oligospora]|nr:hypothetical protein TWF225_009247 [Orbilia oligospora]KAF3269880.1 hypothetical protein TWF217_008231 [Orbilia oligospora]KAF3270337.1 hypothetical protein TWF128_004122 [Orbilia oligospora]KAF3276208.1 hypothetical protein TWF132_002301 [Orbilia oligospora]
MPETGFPTCALDDSQIRPPIFSDQAVCLNELRDPVSNILTDAARIDNATETIDGAGGGQCESISDRVVDFGESTVRQLTGCVSLDLPVHFEEIPRRTVQAFRQGCVNWALRSLHTQLQFNRL